MKNIQRHINYFKASRKHLSEMNLEGLLAHNKAIELLEKELTKSESRESVSNSVLFKEDLEWVEKAVLLYPLGSHDVAQISRLSGFLQQWGIDVANELKKICDERGIDY